MLTLKHKQKKRSILWQDLSLDQNTVERIAICTICTHILISIWIIGYVRLPIVGTNINQLESAEVINPTTLVFSKKSNAAKDFKELKAHSNFHQIRVEALRVSPQLFSIESIVSKISEFILKSDSLRDNLEFKTFTHVVKGVQQFTKEYLRTI